MGDPTLEVSEENRDASQMAKGQAMEAISEGNVVLFSGIICFCFVHYTGGLCIVWPLWPLFY